MAIASATSQAAILALVDDAPHFSGEPDVKCPVCTEHSPPAWHSYETHTVGGYESALKAGPSKDSLNQVRLDWMRCSNEACEQLIIRISERLVAIAGNLPTVRTDEWLARPRFGQIERSISPLVKDPHRTNYFEAAALLDISPRMSAVLARRIVGDLLKQYAGKTHWGLTARIRAFVSDGNHPSTLTTNLDHLREIADFGAHTQETEQESDSGEMEVVIIDADRDDAEWTLDLVDRLFDYLIVTPARDEEMKSKWDKNIERTGRKDLRKSDEGDG